MMQVYLPMSYVWGMRGTCNATPLTEALRTELYVRPYDSIDWNAARNQCAKQDLYYPHPLLQVRPILIDVVILTGNCYPAGPVLCTP